MKKLLFILVLIPIYLGLDAQATLYGDYNFKRNDWSLNTMQVHRDSTNFNVKAGYFDQYVPITDTGQFVTKKYVDDSASYTFTDGVQESSETVSLGGLFNNPVSLIGTTAGYYTKSYYGDVKFGSGFPDSSSLDLKADSFDLKFTNVSVGNWEYGVRGNASNVMLYADNPVSFPSGDLRGILLHSNGMVVYDEQQGKGLYYDADYSGYAGITDRWIADKGYVDAAVAGGSGSVSFGTQYQIPYTNSTTDGFDYSSNLEFNGSTLTLDELEVNGTFIESNSTIADNDATPDVSGANFWEYNGTTNAVTVTDLDNPVVGAIYHIMGNSETYTITINDGGNFNLSGNWVGGVFDVITLYVRADNQYVEISRSDN